MAQMISSYKDKDKDKDRDKLRESNQFQDRIGSDHIIVGLEKVRRAEEGGGKLVWNANPPKCHKDHTSLLHIMISMKKLFSNVNPPKSKKNHTHTQLAWLFLRRSKKSKKK